MKILKSPFVQIVWYVVVFALIQYVVSIAGIILWQLSQGMSIELIIQNMLSGNMGDPMMYILISVVSSILTILVFALCKWCPISRDYLKSRPWVVLLWVVLLSIGTILPSEWLQETLDMSMPEVYTQMFQKIMSNRWGYLVVGILAPIAEEMVFRGAILRVLLRMFHSQWHWLAILLSTLLFGAIHGNLPQFIHASLLGLLLGWLYYRSGSIIPGIVLHWVNNTVAYVAYNLMPWAADAKLIDLFGGNERTVWLSLLCSACIFLPALFQLAVRMKKE